MSRSLLHSRHRSVTLLAAVAMATPVLLAQGSLHVNRGTAKQSTAGLQGMPATETLTAAFSAALAQANCSRRGEAWFVFTAVYTDPATHAETPVMIRVPVSSTEYPYGEERSCDVSDPAHPRLTFSAGLDEQNYLTYRGSAAPPRVVRFSLSKYLCRVLAAPFRCGGRPIRLSSDLSRWKLAADAGVTLSADAPATLRSTPVEVQQGGRFDIAQCPVIAPSGGLCCVEGRTTEWHCGGTPAGRGWHQVSGECFHRETGGSCKN